MAVKWWQDSHIVSNRGRARPLDIKGVCLENVVVCMKEFTWYFNQILEIGQMIMVHSVMLILVKT